ncbi:MAG TPA: TIGR02270 family protein [Pirellulales bacterium]|nr:TIGR02270 family protein [Pirellulales bacterium]
MTESIANIVAQHAEEAAFLWLLRDAAAVAPHYALEDLARLDGRLDAHLEGLRVAGADGWSALASELEKGQPGEVFACAAVALASGDAAKLDQVVETAVAAPPLGRAVVAALGWLPTKTAMARLQPLLASSHAAVRPIALAGAVAHRQHPGAALEAALKQPEPALRSVALRAVGKLGALKHLPEARAALKSSDVACRFAAAWTLGLLAPPDRDVMRTLQDTVLDVPRWRDDALQVLMRRVDVAGGGKWLAACFEKPELQRLAIIGFGYLGDPAAVPRLIEVMKQPALARVAGEAFCAITGLHLQYDRLEAAKPAGFEAGPTESPADDAVEPDPDESLPWPDQAKVARWWSEHSSRFAPGVRHLLGKPISVEGLAHALAVGRQRQRAAAAVELAIRRPGTPLFEVRAPGFRQLASLPTVKPTA